MTSTDRQQYTVPVVGPVFVGAKDLAVMTDGATIVSFNVMSGAVTHQEFFPEKNVRILRNEDDTLVFVHGGKAGLFDRYGRPVRPR